MPANHPSHPKHPLPPFPHPHQHRLYPAQLQTTWHNHHSSRHPMMAPELTHRLNRRLSGAIKQSISD